MTRSKNIANKTKFTRRLELQELINQGLPKIQIARLLGIDKTTVYREIKRCKGAYNAEEAQIHADEREKIKSSNASKYRNEIRAHINRIEERLTKIETKIYK